MENILYLSGAHCDRAYILWRGPHATLVDDVT